MSTATASTVTVSVTQEHIDQGLPGNCSECAVALAVIDTLPDVGRVKVKYWDHGADDAREPEVHALVMFISGDFRRFRLPYEAAGNVGRIDSGIPVPPFAFEMTEVPS